MKTKTVSYLVCLILLAIPVSAFSITGFFTGLLGDDIAVAISPKITNYYADPIKVMVGQELRIVVSFEDDYGVESATVTFPFEGGFDTVTMELIDGTGKKGTYVGTWTAHDTKNRKWYHSDVTLTNKKGKTGSVRVAWEDPTVSHPAAQITPGSFQTGDYIFPSGNVSIGTTGPSATFTVYDTSTTSMNISNALFVDGSNNRVGIGISNPSQLLTVAGDANISAGDIFLTDDQYIGRNSNTFYKPYDTAGGATSIASEDDINIYIDSDNNGANQAFRIMNGSTSYLTANEILTVQQDGDVGIGTTDPIYDLHITGGLLVNGDNSGTDKAVAVGGNQFLVMEVAGTNSTGNQIVLQGRVQSNSPISRAIQGYASDAGIGVRGISVNGIGVVAEGGNISLQVIGNATMSGGLLANYDSGWIAEESLTTHRTTLNHNLGTHPTRIEIWFSNSTISDYVYLGWPHGTPNQANAAPESVRINTTHIDLDFWAGDVLYRDWNLGSATTWESGNMRVLLWL